MIRSDLIYSRHPACSRLGLESMVDIVTRDLGNKSREFYEFVLPPVDMRVHENKITVTADLPGFDKKDVSVRLYANILHISAVKPAEKAGESLICNQRPGKIDKKIRLPVEIKAGEEVVESARLADGILAVVIPFRTQKMTE